MVRCERGDVAHIEKGVSDPPHTAAENVVLDRVLRMAGTSQQTSIQGPSPALEAARRAPSVPQRGQAGSLNTGCDKGGEKLKVARNSGG